LSGRQQGRNQEEKHLTQKHLRQQQLITYTISWIAFLPGKKTKTLQADIKISGFMYNNINTCRRTENIIAQTKVSANHHLCTQHIFELGKEIQTGNVS
jgi:hypothetical protein